jgi:pantoate--beta-alanine ligase
MEILRTTSELGRRLRSVQRQGLRVGLVPTMGALHEGHLSLVREAKARAEVVCASIFVNPTQFGPNEDFDRYPRDLEGDAAKLASVGCDVVFAPEITDMYPEGAQTLVEVTEISQGLCGAHRPGHFRGVTTIVAKLLCLARPDVAVFGQKDYQQLAVIRQMARDLFLDTEIVGAPIVRDPDGLALSSRNAYLSTDERDRALCLSRALARAEEVFAGGERKAGRLVSAAWGVMTEAGVTPEYLEVRDATDLSAVETIESNVVVLVAAQVGKTRLIDNRVISVQGDVT